MTREREVQNAKSILEAIAEADVISDPLDCLVQNTATDPYAAFRPEIIDGLVALKSEDPEAFEVLRADLKEAGCRVCALDEAMNNEEGAKGRSPTQADILISLPGIVQLFHSPDGRAFAELRIGDHRETLPVRKKEFRAWLSRKFYEQTQSVPNSEALKRAIDLIEAKAIHDGPELPVFIRVGSFEERLYLDLADEAWRAVEIRADGWQVVDELPINFIRPAGMKPLPIPEQGGSIDALRSFLNVNSDDDFVLVVSWALAALRNLAPYPVVVLSGEQGSAKSTFSAVLRSLLDPNTAPLRALPREERDLYIAASNGHVLAFDNVSQLPSWMSDALCRLASGGGFAIRQLYTDQDEVLFDFSRPVVLNGIEDIISRPDLADRAILLTLEAIPESRRRPEAEFWAKFEDERPRILGALLDATAMGLKMLPYTKLDGLPRLADFALWATACEPAFWAKGTFEEAYSNNLDDTVDNVIEADPVATAICDLVAKRTTWRGTATELLSELSRLAGDRTSRSKNWPVSPKVLSNRLRRAATFLRKAGIETHHSKEGRARTRIIAISKKEDPPC